jgi:hypothetical protein
MKIHIPEPCDENWDKMTPTEQGAFCKKCAIDVMDFTKKSPFEIRNILSEKFQNKERSCGHIQHKQLQAVNDIGFYWKNEQQRFQSVWMVSLLAVFGLTLFSCQNTVSKEIVAKMEQEANEVLQDSLSDLANVEDTLKENDPWENVVTDVEIVHYDGMMAPDDDWEVNLETYIVCEIGVSGFMTTFYGDIAVEEEDTDAPNKLALSRLMFGNNGPETPQPSGENYTPWPHRKNTSKRIDLVFDTTTDDFIAYITPAPLQLESKLVIESFGDHEIYLTLENVKTMHFHTDKKIDVKEGVQAYSLGLDKLPKGDYELELHSWRTSQTLQFHWQGMHPEA